MNPAICCGNRIIAATTTVAVQSSTSPKILPFTAHCRARRCCQKPTAKSMTDSARHQGRNLCTNALAPAAPIAAANATGKQQPIVARELRIAPADAEMPDPCLTYFLPRGPLVQHAASSLAVERPLVERRDTFDRQVQRKAASAAPLQCPVH
jgi:hypothetical protein